MKIAACFLDGKTGHEAGRQQFDAAPDKRPALLAFWVLKEAAAKFTGEGLQGFPRNTDCSLTTPRVTQRNGCLVAVIEENDKL